MNAIRDFIERCPNHPNVGSAFRILLHLKIGGDLKTYLLCKLKFYYGQGDAHTVFQLLTVIEDLVADALDLVAAHLPPNCRRKCFKG